jgi:putative DNA primase/helicase
MTLAPSNGLPPPSPRAPLDDAVRLFELILPSQGFYVAAIKRKTGRGFQHIFCETPEELWEELEENDRDGFEVYFACSSFKVPQNNPGNTPPRERRYGRTHHNVCAVKAFWLDIDVGKDKPYKTRDEALAALAAFVEKLNLPRPIVVGSGGDKSGLHCYWPLSQDIDRALWQHYAYGLKYLCDCVGHILHADRMRTADPSSVLRPPGAHNRKHGPEVLVEVNARDLEIEPYTLAQFDVFSKNSWGQDPRQPNNSVAKPARAPRQRQRQAKQRANGNGQEQPRRLTDARIYSGEPPPSYVAEILKHCGQMQRLHDEKGQTEEPHWHACLGVCAYCKDGDDFAHKLSEGDSRYTWEETQEKLERWRGSVDGATTCKHFHDEVDPAICEKCEYWGKKNSPYALGITPRVEEEEDSETYWDYITRLPGKVQSSLRFEYTQKGTAFKSPSYINAEAMITVLGIKGSHDVFHDTKTIIAPDGIPTKLGPKLSDAICRAVRRFSARVFRADFGAANIQQALEATCEANQFDPICDYLTGLHWDGVPRLDRWLITYCGAEDTPLNRAFGRKTLIAAVRRARQPGCKFDHMLILEGKQRAGKSSLWKILAGGDDNFSDLSILHENSQKQQEQLAGRWIYEIAELKDIYRTDVETLKSFLSRTNDRGRAAYGRYVKEQPRRGIIVGTTNSAEYLRDATGGSRFWPVAVSDTIDLEAIERDRDQLWAEAAHYEAKGESLIIPQELWGVAAVAQDARMLRDPWEDILSVVEGEIVQGDGESWEERISTFNLLGGYLNISRRDMSDRDTKRIAPIMRDRLGWRGPKVMRFKVKTAPADDPDRNTADDPECKKTRSLSGYWRPAEKPQK